MLAQSFRSADELGITEPQKDALIKTLVLLETERLTHNMHESIHHYATYEYDAPFSGQFNMACWRKSTPCGTAGCIGGTAEMISGDQELFDDYDSSEGGYMLSRLFSPGMVADWTIITPAQSARALRSYLSTGDAKWHEAVA